MVRVGGLTYACEPLAGMGARISDLRMGGKPLDARAEVQGGELGVGVGGGASGRRGGGVGGPRHLPALEEDAAAAGGERPQTRRRRRRPRRGAGCARATVRFE